MRFVIPCAGVWIIVRSTSLGFDNQEIYLDKGDTVEIGDAPGEAICMKRSTTRPPKLFNFPGS